MTNFEHYIDDIVNCVLNDEYCDLCTWYNQFTPLTYKEMKKEMKAWLLAEYIPPKKLTKRERAFCEYAQEGWVARDGNGTLCFFYDKPEKDEDCEHWFTADSFGYEMLAMLFPFITYKDNDPYSIKKMLTWKFEE